MSTPKSLTVGDHAPDFTLPANPGGSVTLSEVLRDRHVVLFFYPKDESSGCTAEACSFRDAYEEFAEAGAEIIGISQDSVDAHTQFQSRFRLPMLLATDGDGAVRAAYGVKATLGLFPGRVTFVIDRGGVIRHVFSSQIQATRHVREALAVLKTLAPPRALSAVPHARSGVLPAAL